jgi:hypothetical protein
MAEHIGDIIKRRRAKSLSNYLKRTDPKHGDRKPINNPERLVQSGAIKMEDRQ